MAILRVKGQDGKWVEIPAIVGPTGPMGPTGKDGKTPARGTDYWTEADKAEIVSAVLDNFTDVSEVGA